MGLEFFTFLTQPENQHCQNLFNGAMTCFTAYSGEKLAAGVDFGRYQTLVDLGGNRGTFFALILEYHPNIQQGIVFDLPNIVAASKNAEDFKSRKIPTDKYTFIAGDMFDSSTIPQADAYVLKSICHDHNDEQAVAILLSIRKANENRKGPPVTIFIIDHVILDDETMNNWQTNGIDLSLACLFNNTRERTLKEFQILLEKAGFEFKKFHPIALPRSTIEAIFV
ncbi:unnamed protein product [Didymodactylos carnosus]|uniref:Acetylserotonin O-methyltransferase n=1 Tax=Didymodactylos carnosus TaxID=1234261 RepID=A0A8S2H5G5_9BILA|nr:unnamed protein product [Didymodactylos carnosus]CAF3604022.1 unnamed protein product [Didymodactylos carnosus]